MRKMISVCMATFNGQKFILKQVQSILCQLNDEDELIIIDDKSTDNTVKILKKLDDIRIKILINPSNMGSIFSFNKALSLAIGEYIFLSDQDDIWYSNKIDASIEHLEKDKLDLIVHDARVVDVDKKHVISESLFRLYDSSPNLIRNLISSRHTGCCMVIKKTALKKLLPIPILFDKKSLIVSLFSIQGIQHDAWLGVLSGVYRFKKKFIPTPLIDYQRHGNNESPLKRKRPFYSALIDRMILIVCLLLRVACGGFKFLNEYRESK